jgi:hypothetical protein
MLIAVSVVLGATGCDRESSSTTSNPAPPTTTPAAAPQGTADHPNRIELGVKKVGALELRAAQDEPIKPGGEGAFDLVITGGKPKAVRFWVGTEDAKGSVKGKAEEETPDNWHTHVEVPDPLPAGSKFHAEVEPATCAKFTVSFDLKQQ